MANPGSRTAPRIVVALAQVPAAVLSGGGNERTVRRRLQSQVGRVLVCKAAAELTGLPPGDFRVAGGGGEPPVLMMVGCNADAVAIGIAHSGGLIAAVAGLEIKTLGVDVQEISPRPVAAITEFMGWSEFIPGNSGDTPASADALTQLWTLWEAAVKCEGADVLTRTLPSFRALSQGFVPGNEGYWSAGGYWVVSRRINDAGWLTLVGAHGSHATPIVATRRVPWSPELMRDA